MGIEELLEYECYLDKSEHIVGELDLQKAPNENQNKSNILYDGFRAFY